MGRKNILDVDWQKRDEKKGKKGFLDVDFSGDHKETTWTPNHAGDFTWKDDKPQPVVPAPTVTLPAPSQVTMPSLSMPQAEKRPETNILDLDWEHENYEPIAEHGKYHPIQGPPPAVPHTESSLDQDVHPDARSDLYAGDTESLSNNSLERAQRAYKQLTS